MIPTPKQTKALDYLTNDKTEFVGYGGAAGGGKSYLGCFWLMQLGYYAPGTKYFIGRDSLKDTKASVLKTWVKLANSINFKAYKFSYNLIIFDNGSEVELLDLSFYPQKEPLYERFGSKEYTAGWIEEAAPVHYMAFEILKSRIGRWMNKEYNIKKKILCTFNPRKTWVYNTFYKPFRDDCLTSDTIFIPALATDNQHLPDDYIETLKNLKDEVTKQRLLYGNFDYDDDPALLVDYDAINDMFTNSHVSEGVKHISADLAMQGRDKFVAGLWSGMRCSIKIDMDKSDAKEIEKALTKLKTDNGVPNSKIVADSDGLGQYLSAYIRNIYTFHGGHKPFDRKTYFNLKSECAFKLAEQINNRQIYIECTREQEDIIKAEISACLKHDNIDNDERRKKIISKDKMKEYLGHSPDYMDMLLMRMVFVKTNKVKPRAGVVNIH